MPEISIPQNRTLDKSERSENRKNIVLAAKGGSITFAGQIFAFLFSFGFTLLITRFLGAHLYGLYRLSLTVALIVAALSSLGLTGGLTRFIPIALKEKNEARVWGTIQVGTAVPVIVALLLTIVLLFAADTICIRLFKKPDLIPVIRIASMSIPFLVLMNCLSAVAVGFKNVQYEIYTQKFGQNILNMIFSVVVLLLGFGLFGVTAAYVLAVVLSLILNFYLVNRLFSFKRPINTAIRNTRELFRFSIPLYLSRVQTRFGKDFETLILGVFAVVSDVGVYAVLLRVSNLGRMFSTSLRHISSPIIAELHSQNKFKELENYYQTITKWSLSLNLPIFLCIIIFNKNILMIFGEDFTIGATALIIMAISVLYNAATGICGTVINMTGYSKVGFYNSIVYLITTIALDFLLIPKWHLIGAAWAAALTIVILNTMRMIEVYALINGLLPFNRSFLKPVTAALVSGSLAYVLSRTFWIDEPIIQLLILVPILWVSYLLIIIALKLSDEDQMILKKIQNRLKIRRKG